MSCFCLHRKSPDRKSRSRLQAQISEDQWDRKQQCLSARTRKHRILLIVEEEQTAARKALRFKTGHIWRRSSGVGCGDVPGRKITPSEQLKKKKKTTITTAIVSKTEATEIHPDKSKWSEAISEWKGPAMGFRDITDEINNPLVPSEEAGTISTMFYPWIVTQGENWMVQGRRHVVMVTERDGPWRIWKWKHPAQWGILTCVTGGSDHRADLDPARWRA